MIGIVVIITLVSLFVFKMIWDAKDHGSKIAYYILYSLIGLFFIGMVTWSIMNHLIYLTKN